MDDVDFGKIEIKKNSFRLSAQAVGALMMALQASLMNQSDILPVLEAWELQDTPHGLIVLNPSVVEIKDDDEE